MKLNEIDLRCKADAEAAFIENVNHSQAHNEALREAVVAFVNTKRGCSLGKNFPFENATIWRNLERDNARWCTLRKLVKLNRYPTGYAGLTYAATCRLIIEHFTGDLLFRDTQEQDLTKTNPASEIPLPTPTEIPTMSNNKVIVIQKVTFVSTGSERKDIKLITVGEAVQMIQASENQINELKGLKNKPKVVTNQIFELQEGINALVRELDSREEAK